MSPSSKSIPHVVVVRPAVQVGRQQAFFDAGVAQMAEHLFYKENVAGSTPVARTMNTKTANVHLGLLQLTSAGTAVCVLA